MFFRDKKIVREFLEMFPDYEIKTFLGGIRDVWDVILVGVLRLRVYCNCAQTQTELSEACLLPVLVVLYSF